MSANAVRFVEVDARPTAVVAETSTWAEFPSLCGQLLREVYGFVRHGRADPSEAETEVFWLLR